MGQMNQKNESSMDIRVIISFSILFIIIIALLITNHVNSRHDEPDAGMIEVDPFIYMTLDERETFVYQSLINAGYTPARACGILGNIAVESPDFDPSAFNEKSGASGLFQWTDDGDRKQTLKDYCREHDMQWDSAKGQISFAVYEIHGGP
jgi:hypothetical protein